MEFELWKLSEPTWSSPKCSQQQHGCSCVKTQFTFTLRSIAEFWERVVVPLYLWLSTPLCQSLFLVSIVWVFSTRRHRPGIAVQVHVSHCANSQRGSLDWKQSCSGFLLSPGPKPVQRHGPLAFSGHQKSPSLLRYKALTNLLLCLASSGFLISQLTLEVVSPHTGSYDQCVQCFIRSQLDSGTREAWASPQGLEASFHVVQLICLRRIQYTTLSWLVTKDVVTP